MQVTRLASTVHFGKVCVCRWTSSSSVSSPASTVTCRSPGSLWKAPGKPQEPPGKDAGGVHLGIHSAVQCRGTGPRSKKCHSTLRMINSAELLERETSYCPLAGVDVSVLSSFMTKQLSSDGQVKLSSTVMERVMTLEISPLTIR